MLAILGICIKSTQFSRGKRSLWIYISSQQIDNFEMLCSSIVSQWCGWRLGQRRHRLWGRLSSSGGWRSTCSFASPDGLPILCDATLERKAYIRVVSTKQRRVSSIAVFTILCSGNSTFRYCSSQTSAQHLLIRYCVSSVATGENPLLAILAVCKARRVLDCSSCTRPPCLAIVADMLKSYKKLVAASKNEIWQLPLPYTLP